MTNLTQFSTLIASDLIQDQNQFPVDFNLAWQWLGYGKKSDAKEALLNCNFQEEIDFRIKPQLGTLAVPRPAECITLTVDCFKTWGMMAGTEQGKLVRMYFLECEKELRKKVPQSYGQALLEAGRLQIELEIKQAQLAEAESKIQADLGRVLLGKAIEESVGNLSIGEFAKITLNYGRNKLFEKLRDLKILMSDNVPYQNYVDSGYFQVTEKVTQIGVKPVTLVTPKGQTWLSKKLN